VDIPSGLHADTGMILGAAVSADLTATYGLAKPAHFLHGGRMIGQLHIVDISIPAVVPRQLGLKGRGLVREHLPPLPRRAVDAHKGKNGHLLVLAGSEGKTGAAILCCQAALRAGCGLVSAAVPCDLNTIFETSLIEAMTLPLPESSTVLSMDDLDFILAAAVGKQAVVIGPGIGTDDTTQELLLFLYREIDLPMVIDADGLNILAMHPDAMSRPGGPRLLTPHPGEMARLLKKKTSAIQADRIGAALALVEGMDTDMVVALKGAGTVIADNQGNWAINTTGNPGMAAAGMGDVLAGLCGSLFAQGMTAWQSACLGVYAHGLAADMLTADRAYGFTAMEVADSLPLALQETEQAR
jgi:NAD(P)H-hydrate epimerase